MQQQSNAADRVKFFSFEQAYNAEMASASWAS
jgi:hypothetical protein